MTSLFLLIFLFVVALLVLGFVVCFIMGKGDSLKSRMSSSFHRLLQWADIESPLSTGKNETSQVGNNIKVIMPSRVENEVIIAFEQSQKKIEEVVNETSNNLRSDFQQQLNHFHQVLEYQTQEIKSLRQLLTVKEYVFAIPQQTSDPHTGEHSTYPSVRYGKLVDSKIPLGFIEANLAESSSGCCFIITILSKDKATYRLADDFGMRQEALQMFHPIISTACEYDHEPGVINDAVNVEEGVLHLKEGVWRIDKKNKVNLI